MIQQFLFLTPGRYSAEADVEFVRKAIRAISQCAIKIEQAASRCVDALLAAIKTNVSYVLQEAIVVMKVCHYALCDCRSASG